MNGNDCLLGYDAMYSGTNLETSRINVEAIFRVHHRNVGAFTQGDMASRHRWTPSLNTVESSKLATHFSDYNDDEKLKIKNKMLF